MPTAKNETTAATPNINKVFKFNPQPKLVCGGAPELVEFPAAVPFPVKLAPTVTLLVTLTGAKATLSSGYAEQFGFRSSGQFGAMQIDCSSGGAAMLGTEIGVAQRVLNCLVREKPMREASDWEIPREVRDVTARLMK